MKDVIVFGSALLDIYMKSKEFRRIESGEFEGGAALAEAYGGKIEVEEMEATTGGAGTNVAVSLARKDIQTALVAEMGRDVIGQMIKLELEREGVDLSLLVEEEDEETGLSTIYVGEDGGRAAAIYRGASKMLTIEDMRWDELRAEWFYIGSLGGQVELMETLVNHASERGIKVALNPGGAEIERLKHEPERLRALVGKLEVLLINKEELEEMQGEPVVDSLVWGEESIVSKAKITIMTNGKQGGQVCTVGKCWRYEPIVVEAVEETGAGDAFGSGLVAGLIKGRSVEEAVEWGKRQAASVVQAMGPKRGLLTFQQLSEA